MNQELENQKLAELSDEQRANVDAGLWKDGRLPSVVCRAHKTNGDPCKKPPIKGATVCRFHGGAAPAVKAAARARLENAADRMAKELLRIAVDDDAGPAVKLAAIKDALDRAGLSAKTAVDVTVGPRAGWEELLDGISQLEGGSRAEARAARGVRDTPPRQHDVVDAEVVEEQPECEGCGLVWGGRPLPSWLDAYPEYCKTCRAERGLPRPGRDGRSYPSPADVAELRQPPAPTGPPSPAAARASASHPYSDGGMTSYEDAVAAYALAQARRGGRERQS